MSRPTDIYKRAVIDRIAFMLDTSEEVAEAHANDESDMIHSWMREGSGHLETADAVIERQRQRGKLPRPDVISPGDVDMIQYFHNDKGDLTRWGGWDEKLPLFQKHYPALVKAHRDLVAAQQVLDMIVNALEPIESETP